jgi:hypothetical protein
VSKVHEIIEMHNYLDTTKRTLATEFQEIVDYVLPDRSNVQRWESPGQRRGTVRYDSTAVEAAEILAGNLAATLTPQASVWFQLVTKNPQLRQMKKVVDWCQEVRDLMLGAMSTSNFYLAMDEVYLDLVGFGTAAPYAEMLNGRLHYQCWPIKDYVFTVGIDGRANAIYRKFKMTAEQVFNRFSRHPGKKELGDIVTAAMSSTADAQASQREIEVIHCIAPREKYTPGKPGFQNMPIESVYVNVDDRVIMAEGGYEEMPVSIARWRVTSDDAGWGRGPGSTSMPDVRSLNAAKRMIHRAAAKDLDPPLIIEDRGVIGSVRTTPNGITYKRKGAEVDYLTSGSRMDLGIFDVQELKSQIRSVFYADHLRMPPPQGTPMTATETQIRWELMERLLGPTLGRVMTELLNPGVERTFGLMMRTGQLPEPPQEMMEEEIDIEYQGPLARAQKQPEIAAIERTFAAAAGLDQMTQSNAATMRLNPDEAVKILARLHGFPADGLRDDDEIAAMQQQQQEAMAAQQERQDAALAADMAGKVQGAAA